MLRTDFLNGDVQDVLEMMYHENTIDDDTHTYDNHSNNILKKISNAESELVLLEWSLRTVCYMI